MVTLTCSSSGSGDFALFLDGTQYECISDSAPFVLVEQGGLTAAEFSELYGHITLLLVTAFGIYMVRRMFF